MAGEVVVRLVCGGLSSDCVVLDVGLLLIFSNNETTSLQCSFAYERHVHKSQFLVLINVSDQFHTTNLLIIALSVGHRWI